MWVGSSLVNVVLLQEQARDRLAPLGACDVYKRGKFPHPRHNDRVLPLPINQVPAGDVSRGAEPEIDEHLLHLRLEGGDVTLHIEDVRTQGDHRLLEEHFQCNKMGVRGPPQALRHPNARVDHEFQLLPVRLEGAVAIVVVVRGDGPHHLIPIRRVREEVCYGLDRFQAELFRDYIVDRQHFGDDLWIWTPGLERVHRIEHHQQVGLPLLEEDVLVR